MYRSVKGVAFTLSVNILENSTTENVQLSRQVLMLLEDILLLASSDYSSQHNHGTTSLTPAVIRDCFTVDI